MAPNDDRAAAERTTGRRRRMHQPKVRPPTGTPRSRPRQRSWAPCSSLVPTVVVGPVVAVVARADSGPGTRSGRGGEQAWRRRAQAQKLLQGLPVSRGHCRNSRGSSLITLSTSRSTTRRSSSGSFTVQGPNRRAACMAAIDGCSREDGVVKHRDRCTRRPEPAGKSTRQHPGEHRDGRRHEWRQQPPARKPASILGVGDADGQPRLLRPEVAERRRPERARDRAFDEAVAAGAPRRSRARAEGS